MKKMTLKVKIKVTSFKLVQNLQMINEQFFVKAKLQNSQFKSSKLLFCKFKGQFKLDGQGQDHQFLK